MCICMDNTYYMQPGSNVRSAAAHFFAQQPGLPASYYPFLQRHGRQGKLTKIVGLKVDDHGVYYVVPNPALVLLPAG